jgi:hypothetical protein
VLSTRSAGPSEIHLALLVQNLGQYPFALSVCRWRLEWTQEFRPDIDKAIADRELGGETPELATWRFGTPDGYVAPSGVIDFGGAKLLGSSKVATASFRWTDAMARDHFKRCLIPIDGFKPSWATYHFEVPVTSDLGDAVFRLGLNALGGELEAT